MFLQLIINTLIVGSGYALVGMAFRLMYSVSPFFNMTIGCIATFSAYMTYLLHPYIGWTAVPLAVMLAAGFSFALELFVYTPMRNGGASAMVLLVVSLGIYTMFEAVIQMTFGPNYRILGSFSASPQISLGITSLPLVQLLSIVASLLMFALLGWFLHKTFIGKEIRAIADSSTLANIIGINVPKVITIVSAITGVVLGIAGVLVGFDTGMEPTMGFNLMFKGMIAAIIGGVTIRGAFFGAMFLALAENAGVYFFASEWRDLIAFTTFIVFLYVRPHGIFHRKEIV